MKTIRVTAKHIKEGKSNCEDCPIVHSLVDAGFKSVKVFGDGMAVIERDYIELPRSARLFINAFDSGKKVKPFSFRIDV